MISLSLDNPLSQGSTNDAFGMVGQYPIDGTADRFSNMNLDCKAAEITQWPQIMR